MAQRAAHPGSGGLVAAGLAVVAVTYGLARYGYGLYLPAFSSDFGLSAGAAGAIGAGGYARCRRPGRPAGGRRPAAHRPVVAGGSAALGCLVVASAWNGPVLAAGALLAGSGAGAATPATVAAVAGTVPDARVPRAQGVVNSGTGAGVVAGGLLVLAVPGAWRWSWVGFAVLAVLATAWADRAARWPAMPGRRAGGAERHDGEGSGPGCGGRWWPPSWPERGARRWTFGRDLLAEEGGLPDRLTGLLWCVLGAAGLLGGVSGVLVVRVGTRAAWISSVLAAAAGTLALGMSRTPRCGRRWPWASSGARSSP